MRARTVPDPYGVRVKTDWVPFSAALLLTGALALALGSLLIPSSDGGTDTMRIVEDQGGQWMAAAAIYLVASVFLTLGLPTALVLLRAAAAPSGSSARSRWSSGSSAPPATRCSWSSSGLW